MRIVFDMQGAQAESRFRGIGRYTLAFAQAVARNRGEHELMLALNGTLADTIEPIRSAFEGLLPREHIRVWSAPAPFPAHDAGNAQRRKVAALCREAFLASLHPDIVHVSSLFEGYSDDAVASVGAFDRRTPTSVSLYDLIPLLNSEHYLGPNPRYAEFYREKVGELEKAEVLLAISESTRREARACLGDSVRNVVNVSTAIGAEFQPLEIGEAGQALRSRFDLARPFVLYSGGADERKNLARLVEAWAGLPGELRSANQLLFAGRMPDESVARLRRLAREHGLSADELRFVGYVTDRELVGLYSLCKLFVFPSWHEGFGLPALEAMACGAPVIAANATSLPEVVGLEEALFDPMDVAAIRGKLAEALTDEAFRTRLKEHGWLQSRRFTWDEVASRAIEAWERCVDSSEVNYPGRDASTQHRLVEALAPLIEDCDDAAVASLAGHIASNASAGLERQLLLDVSELCQHDAATGVQRVVRGYLNQLLRNPPAGFRVEPVYATTTEGYRYAHRYKALVEGGPSDQLVDPPLRWRRGDIFFALDMQHHVQLHHAEFFSMLRQQGVVVKFMVYDLLPIQLPEFFRDGAKALHENWLNLVADQDGAVCISRATAGAFQNWIRENHVRTTPGFSTDWVHMGADLQGTSPSKGVPDDAAAVMEALSARPSFLVVSTLEPRKRHEQILDALEILWETGLDVNLVFVGQEGWQVGRLADRIKQHAELERRLFWIRGASDEYLDRIYRGSTCLIAASVNEGFGLPLIEAARHGLPVVARDIPVFREVAGDSAYYFSGDDARQLAGALSDWLQLHKAGRHPASDSMSWLSWEQSSTDLKRVLTQRNYPSRQLFVDISELIQRDAQSGIQRVVRSLLKEFFLQPPAGYRIEAVYAAAAEGYRYARRFVGEHFGSSEASSARDDFIEPAPGDVFVGLDLAPAVVPEYGKFYKYLRDRGVAVKFVVYDLQPLIPEYFEKVHEEAFLRWLRTVVAESDELLCISNAVANDVSMWIERNSQSGERRPSVHAFRLGTDLKDRASDSDEVRARAEIVGGPQMPTFLMVSTLAPHKGHAQVLDAFEVLWRDGVDARLIVVGKKGWRVDDLAERLSRHPEAGNRLHWLPDVDDEKLKALYSTATCLIAASYTEGFGLPLIEAAQYHVPIIARDIPVFREVAGDNAFFFRASEAQELAESIAAWMRLYAAGEHPLSERMQWLNWKESAEALLTLLLTDDDVPASSRLRSEHAGEAD